MAATPPRRAVRLRLILTQDEARPVAAKLEVVPEGLVCLRLLVDGDGHVTVGLDPCLGRLEDGTAETCPVGLLLPSHQPSSGVTQHTSAAQPLGTALEQRHAALLQEHACLEGLVRRVRSWLVG
jgi:hypothetical protein